MAKQQNHKRTTKYPGLLPGTSNARGCRTKSETMLPAQKRHVEASLHNHSDTLPIEVVIRRAESPVSDHVRIKSFCICKFYKVRPEEPISGKANTKDSMGTIERPGGGVRTCLRDLGQIWATQWARSEVKLKARHTSQKGVMGSCINLYLGD
ncbi:hypothetical protein KC327_g72 [Hortaea werneckii]|nr:hypothetical protein KC327_g72 [Hortaea werneckii]